MAGPIAALLSTALRELDGMLAVREEDVEDYSFVRALFADIRADELAPVPWPEQVKHDFLDSQCRLQRDHYTHHYADAELLLITHGTACIGRVYVHAARSEIRLMEIALLREWRNRGIGSLLVRTLQVEAAGRGVDMSLHVEPQNPAQRMYRRLGFRLIENRGIYDFLGWSPNPEFTAQA